jgi:hypothetical protein
MYPPEVEVFLKAYRPHHRGALDLKKVSDFQNEPLLDGREAPSVTTL